MSIPGVNKTQLILKLVLYSRSGKNIFTEFSDLFALLETVSYSQEDEGLTKGLLLILLRLHNAQS